MLTLEQKYQNYKNALLKCGSKLLKASDEILSYNLLEEFSVDVVSFLHKSVLVEMHEAGLINDTIFEKSTELRVKYLNIEKNTDIFNIQGIRQTNEWKEVLILSDEIQKMLYW